MFRRVEGLHVVGRQVREAELSLRRLHDHAQDRGHPVRGGGRLAPRRDELSYARLPRFNVIDADALDEEVAEAFDVLPRLLAVRTADEVHERVVPLRAARRALDLT